MDRRRLLSTLVMGVAGLAGCNAFNDRSQQPPPTPAPVPTAEPPPATDTPTDTSDRNGSQFSNMASIVDLGTGPRTLSLFPPTYREADGVIVTVRFVAPATAKHPARLRATLRTATDGPTTVALREMPPFQRITAARVPPNACRGDCPATLYLVPTAEHELAPHSPNTERGPKGYWRKADTSNTIPTLPPTVRLGPDESITGEYVLLGSATRIGFPTGQYDFRASNDGGFTIAVWETNAPGPASASRFEGATVPALPDTTSMAWYHNASPQTVAYLKPTTERADLPANVAFTLINHARQPLTGNPYYWKLLKLVNGEWFHIAPGGWPVPLAAVAPGAMKTWTLQAFHDRADEHMSSPGDGLAVGTLGGGTYAFEVGMNRGKRTQAALIALVGKPVHVVPTEGVTTERHGETIVVTAPRHDDAPHSRAATLTVKRIVRKRPVELDTLIAEQVMQPRNRGLRNTLAFFENDIDRVVLHTDNDTAGRVVGYESQGRRFVFNGQAYKATTANA